MVRISRLDVTRSFPVEGKSNMVEANASNSEVWSYGGHEPPSTNDCAEMQVLRRRRMTDEVSDTIHAEPDHPQGNTTKVVFPAFSIQELQQEGEFSCRLGDV